MYGHAADLIKPCTKCPSYDARPGIAYATDGSLVCGPHALEAIRETTGAST